jgi:hypothetical protein
MALSADAKEQFLNAGTRLQELAGDSLKDLLEDVRWFTTLVLASIGGLGAYRELQEAKSLSLPFAIVVVLLCLTLLVLLLTVLTATEMKRRFGHDIHDFTDTVLRTANDDNLAPRDGERLLEQSLMILRRRHSSIVERPQLLQFIGIAAFLIAALIGVIFVLFSEVLVAIFGGGA